MAAIDCPGREQLLAYSLGTLPEDAGEAVASHLETCDACESTIAGLDGASDTFIGRLREPLVESHVAREPEYQRVAARIKATGPRPSPVAPTADPASKEHTATFAPLGELGEYRLLEKLGEGGMGTVYKALHTKLDKLVAVKILRTSRMEDERAVARFEREMKAVGRLNHPNIVQALDAREIDGTSLLVMEYVEGMDLAKLVRHLGPLRIADACELARQAAVGLQYAHEHGLVHRDVKPSNLMLATSGELKILDLGLARLQKSAVEGDELTGTGQMMGTSDYIAPEQALESHTVDIRADVYSLGCTLYRLLCGRPPFSGAEYDTPMKKVTAHVRDPIPPIRTVRDEVPEPLAALVDRMMAKEPAQRFSTPKEVADALEPHCAGSNLQQLVMRESQSVGSVVESGDAAAADAQPGEAKMVAPAPIPSVSADFDPYHRWLSIPPEQQPPNHYRLLGIQRFEEDLDAIESAADRQMAHLRVFQAGQHAEQAAKLLNEVAAARVCLLNPAKKSAYDVRLRKELSPEPPAGKKSAGASPGVVQRSPRPAAAPVAAVSGQADRRFAAVRSRFSGRRPPAKRRLAVAAGAAAVILALGVVFYVATNHGTIRIALSEPTADVQVEVDGETVEITGQDEPLTFRAGEHGLVVSGRGYETVSRSFTVQRGENPVLNVELVSDGNGGPEPGRTVARLDDTKTTSHVARGAEEFRVFEGHTGPVCSVAFTPDGKYVVSGSEDGSARVWEVATGRETARFLGHNGAVSDVEPLPDGERVLSVAHETIILWELRTARETRRFHVSSRGEIAVAPDGKRAVCNGHLGSGDGVVHLFDLTSGEELGQYVTGNTIDDSIKALAFSPDGKHVLCGRFRPAILVIDVDTMTEVRQLEGHTQRVYGVAISQDGHRAASVSWDSSVRIWDLCTGKQTARLGSLNGWGHGVDISADGRRAISAGQDGTVRLWDADTGSQIAEHQQHQGPVLTAAFSLDGRRAISGSRDKTLCLWRLPQPAR